jgi:hypothetical protein
MSPRERLELAQARHAGLGPQPPLVVHPDIAVLEAEIAQLEAGLPALCREVEAHRALHARWDEVRDGRPLHPLAWFYGLLLFCSLFVLRFQPPASSGFLLFVTAGLGSIDGLRWLQRARRSRSLRRDGGGRHDEPVP